MVLRYPRPSFFPGLLPALLLVWVGFPVSVYAKVASYSLSAMGGDQGDFGAAEVQKKAEAWRRQAASVAKTKGSSPAEELVAILNGELGEGVRAYISPDGRVRALDGHHKMRAAQLLLGEMGPEKERVRVSLDVLKDFSGKSWKDYVKFRERVDPAYFPASVRARAGNGRGLVELYQKLPFTLEDMADLPMRSATGGLFEALSLRGPMFRPAVQFRLGEQLSRLGIEVPAGEEFSPATQTRLLKAFFEEPSAPELQKFLIDAALPKARDDVETQIRLAKAILDQRTEPEQLAARMAARSSEELAETESALDHVFLQQPARAGCGPLYSDLGKSVTRLPERIALPKDATIYSALMGAAETKTISRLDLPLMRKVLARLSKGGKLTGEEQRFLKDTRKSSLFLRAALKVIGTDESKRAAKPFRRFVRELGGLNDQIQRWDFAGKVPKDLGKTAKKIGRMIEEGFANDHLEARSVEALHRSNAEFLQWMGKVSSQDSLTVGDYHELRRRVRDYWMLFELITEREPTIENIGTTKFLRDLSKKMGKVKNGLLVNEDRKSAKELLAEPTRIEEETKKQIGDFLGAMGDYRN